MSIRSFVSLCSFLLMVWLVVAFVYTPGVRGGIDPVTPESEPAAAQEGEEAENLTVSVSP